MATEESTNFDRFDEIIDLREALGKETDRGCALLAASYLEYQLRQLIISRLVDDEKLHKELLDGNGGLATFSSRIAMAFALGLISPAVRRDLDLIRKIRNEFGHSAAPIGFDDPPTANRCRELYFRWEPLTKPARRFFENSVFAVAAHIHGATKLAQRPVPPEDMKIDDTVRDDHIQMVERFFRTLCDSATEGPTASTP